jgi:uncharacterized membrane protein
MNRLRQLFNDARSSFWFVPSLAVVDGIVAALALIEVDAVWGDRWLALWPRLFGTGAEGARQMLATLAGSMMSLMGITFSMTLVALALASSQYTSRVLRNFMGSRATQITLGSSPASSPIASLFCARFAAAIRDLSRARRCFSPLCWRSPGWSC